jgi:NAD+ kinase
MMIQSPLPDQEVFSTPPTTPLMNTKYDSAAHLTPSLSRKSSRPSSLRISEGGGDHWRPDVIAVGAGTSPVNGSGSGSNNNSPAAATHNTSSNNKPIISPAQRTPRAGTTQTIEVESQSISNPMAAGTAVSPRVHAQQLQHPLKSPYFVHSHLDRGASIHDWLRNKGPAAAVSSPLSRSGGNMKEEEEELGQEVFEPEEDDEEEYSRRSLTKQLAETAAGVREMSKQLGACVGFCRQGKKKKMLIGVGCLKTGRARIQSNIRNIMIVTKARDNRLIQLTRELALYLMQKRPKGQSRGYVV